MITFVLFMFAGVVDPVPNISRDDESFCSGDDATAPYRFCLAERKHERMLRELERVVSQASQAAAEQKDQIAEFSRKFGGVTLPGDPVKGLKAAQWAWERSYKADCLTVGLASATGNAGTEGVTSELQCEGDRIEERVSYLKALYVLDR